MTLVTWDDNAATGIGTVDMQHKELFELINRLHEELEKGRAGTALHDALDDLKGYVKYHFKHEESVMEKSGYPGLAAHRQLHKGFLEKVLVLEDTPDSHLVEALKELEAYLLEWLMEHINNQDKAFAKHVNEQAQ